MSDPQEVAQAPPQPQQAPQDRRAPAAEPWPPPAPQARRRSIPWYGVAVALLLAATAVLRLWDLDARGMHHDESIHVQLSYNLMRGSTYRHEPAYHGPLQYHVNAALFWLLGASDTTGRLAYALMGIALVGLPFLLRDYLGRWGALLCALLLAVSPSMLYFSRFARNEAYMLAFALGLAVCLWRYLQHERPGYLYVAAGLLALMFTAKETAYLYVAIFGAIFFLFALPDLVPWLLGRVRLSDFRAPGAVFVLLLTLTLPQWSALTSVLAEPLGWTLARPQAEGVDLGVVGMPANLSLTIAAGGIVVAMFLLSAWMGLSWNPRRWLVAALIFYGVWALLYSSFFTSPGGLFTGVWQGMGYWLAQQEVKRGGQPWYYYFVLGSLYEFLALGVGLVAAFSYARKAEAFSLFLVLWALLSFVAYTVAGEKMPWLLANIALPFLLLTGKFLGDVLEGMPWRRVWERWAWPALPLTLALLLVGGRALYLFLRPDFTPTLHFWWSLGAGALFLATLAHVAYRRRRDRALALVGLGVVVALLGMTVVVALRAAYDSADDDPIEMLVYAQGSVSIPRNAARAEALGERLGVGKAVEVTIDNEVTWPAVWYFRDFTRVGYPCLKSAGEGGYAAHCRPLEAPLSAQVLWVTPAHATRDAAALEGYQRTGVWRGTMWFPEVYRNLTPRRIWESMQTKAGWRGPLDYWLLRRLGSRWWASEYYAYYAEPPP